METRLNKHFGSLMKSFTLYKMHFQLKIQQLMYSTHSSIHWLRFVFPSTGARYSSIKKRPWEMTCNSNCRAREFQANRTRLCLA